MNRLQLAASEAPREEAARGRDAGDLARLRDRIEGFERGRSAEAVQVADDDRSKIRANEQELRLASQLDAYARNLEAENQARWMRALMNQAVWSLGTFVAAELLAVVRRKEAAP